MDLAALDQQYQCAYLLPVQATALHDQDQQWGCVKATRQR
jgi:hypothetical protein